MEYKYIPYFSGITMPTAQTEGGTLIDYCFVKTSKHNLTSYKITIPFTDRYF